MVISSWFHTPASVDSVHGTHWIASWKDPRAGKDFMENRKFYSPSRESNPTLDVQTSHYKDWAFKYYA
jgi:hypothetical protein